MRDRSHILVPTDFGPPSREALRVALEMTHGVPARVTLLHVISEQRREGLDAIDYLHEVLLTRRAMENCDRTAPFRFALERIKQEVHPEWRQTVEIAAELRRGDVAAEIARYVSDEAVDVVVLGVRRRGWLSSFRSHRSRQILSHTDCRVLCVHPPAPDPSGASLLRRWFA